MHSEGTGMDSCSQEGQGPSPTQSGPGAMGHSQPSPAEAQNKGHFHLNHYSQFLKLVFSKIENLYQPKKKVIKHQQVSQQHVRKS